MDIIGEKAIGQKRKNRIIIGTLLTIGLLVIGYATLGANLKINGIAEIPAATWNVHFKTGSIVPTVGSVAIDTNAGQQAATIDNATQVSYAVKLALPGDFYEFTVDVENTGSIDAMIDSISSKIKIGDAEAVEIISTGENRNLPSYLDYLAEYSDGTPITAKQLLRANGGTETIKVRIAYKTDIESSDLPGTATTLRLFFQANYVQADSTAITVPHSQTQQIIPEGVYLLEGFDEGVNYSRNGDHPAFSQLTHFSYDTVINGKDAIELAMAQWENITDDPGDSGPVFLRATLGTGTTSGELNVPVEVYIGFVITPEMVQSYPNMVAGTYYIRGWASEIDDVGRQVYRTNVETALSAFQGENDCKYEVSTNHYSPSRDINDYLGANSFTCENDLLFLHHYYTSTFVYFKTPKLYQCIAADSHGNEANCYIRTP